jgi:hypothetical protein
MADSAKNAQEKHMCRYMSESWLGMIGHTAGANRRADLRAKIKPRMLTL